MKLYRIFQDGFSMAQARGKNKAINFLKKFLAWDGIADQAKWGQFVVGTLKVTTNEHEFTIEEAKDE